ncbi:MAG: hypothetical protein OXN89_08415 [Bryobacterales bacterium]|nr:hypothetical protein [Bryobacterales bacterium]
MTATEAHLQRLGLARNPFPPATTGTGFVDDLSLPDRWETELRQLIQQLAESDGDKALLIEGGYGAGKTFILNWIQAKVLPRYRVKPYFFENPGVAFYDLANRLMRQVGRYEVAKALWEMLYRPNDSGTIQQSLFPLEFGQWLATLDNRARRNEAIRTLSRAMQKQQLATDEEILNKLSRLIVETGERPYFEYRDFVPRSSRSLVAEREEPGYFQALVRILGRILDASGIAFLLDEFEDVALARRLNRNQSAAYIATMRRLLDTAQREDFWVILSTTPEGFARTSELDESLTQRFSCSYRIPELSEDEAYGIVARRLGSARLDNGEGLMPFSEDALSGLLETSRSSPRRLIKIMWYAIGLATESEQDAPLPAELVKDAEARLYPERREA